VSHSTIAITPGTGDNIAVDRIATAAFQRVKLVTGSEGVAVDVVNGQSNMAGSLPVVVASNQSAIPVTGNVGVDGSVEIFGTVAVNNFPATQEVSGPVTDAELRATPLPVAVSSSVLATGAATEATLAAVNTKVPAQGQAVMTASLPVVLASDQSAISVTLPDMVPVSYNVGGVIVINTDLLIIDCRGVQAVSIQCTSMGTTGVVTPGWSNNNSIFVNTSIMTPAGVAASTFNAAGLWTTPVLGRYLRLRLTTATTGGTTTLAVQALAQACNLPVVSQPVAVSGSLTSAGTVSTVSTVTTVSSSTPVTPTTTFLNSAASVNATSSKASAGTVWNIFAFNFNAANRYLKLYNKNSAPVVGTDIPVMVIPLLPGQLAQVGVGPNGIRFSAGIAFALTVNPADNDTSAVAAGEIRLTMSWT
jgi:hypothetical protein